MKYEEITSRKNQNVLFTMSLHDKKKRDEYNLFTVEGIKLFSEAIHEGLIPKTVYVTDRLLTSNPELLSEFTCDIFRVTDDVLSKMTTQSAPEGIIGVFSKESVKPVKKDYGITLILEGLQDPGNMGTVLRSGAAFGVSGVITTGCADIYSDKTLRASMGAVFKVPVIDFPTIEQAVDFARENGNRIIATALSKNSVSIDEAPLNGVAVMIGNEGRGLSEKAISLADGNMLIPMENMESLNAAVASSVILYEASKRRRK